MTFISNPVINYEPTEIEVAVVEKVKKARKKRTTKKSTKKAPVITVCTNPLVNYEPTEFEVDVVEQSVVQEVIEVPEVALKPANGKMFTADELNEVYKAMNIKCSNPTAKGPYRIMKGKSSVNIAKTQYNIFTSEEDWANIVAKFESSNEIILDGKTNSQDKNRPYKVIAKSTEALLKLLAVYAMNPMNQLAKA